MLTCANPNSPGCELKNHGYHLAPAVPALNHFSAVFGLNHTFMSHINKRADECGYTRFLNAALTFPPPKRFPTAPKSSKKGCDVWDQVVRAATYVNPCFNMYHLTDFCPFLWDEMGFPSHAGGPNNYFNQSAVQKALHVPPTNYAVCADGVLGHDQSVPSALGPLPSVIERTNNVLIGHGWYDYLLFLNGSLATIQNMTWNGAQGFQKPPIEPLFVPYTRELDTAANEEPSTPFNSNAGAGILGTAHTERGLTFSTVYGAGHGKRRTTRPPSHHYRDADIFAQKSPSMFPVRPTDNLNSCWVGSRVFRKTGLTQPETRSEAGFGT